MSETYQQFRDRRIQEAAARPDPEEQVMNAAEAKRERKRLKLMNLRIQYGTGEPE